MTERVKSIARAQFLGTQRIEIGGEVITPEAERLFGMIVRLSVPLGRLTSRQTMMETLWPGADEANARHNLRQTVYKARELGLVVESGEDGLRLDPRHWSCDWDDATGDVSGEWLPDYEPEFSDELRSWIGSQRIGVHALVRPRLVRSLQAARASGDLIVADRHARQLLQIDELNEEATLTRAELMAMQGAKVDALRLLDAYLHEIGRVGSGKDAALPAQLLRRRIAEKLPSVSYSNGSTHHGPLVARTEEIKRLLASLFDARAGRGAATVLCGSEGIGKSRLLFEVRKSAVLQGMLIVELSCESAPAAVPFSALRALTHRLLELPGALGITPEALSAIREWTGGTTAAPDDCPVVEIEDLLASIAEETPLLLLLEHAERMDAESLGRLDRLYRRGVGRYHALMLTSCTTRVPTESPVELRGIERLPLRPLTLVAVRSIVTAYAAAELPRATEDQIACAAVFAEGNPMYGIEMLGLILDPGSPDVIPWRVKVAVERIVEEMSEVERRVFAISEHLQSSASLSILSQSLDLPETEILHTIDRLESAGNGASENAIFKPLRLVGLEAKRHVPAAIQRRDCARAVEAITADTLNRDLSASDFFAQMRLLIHAQLNEGALELLHTKVGVVLRKESADIIVSQIEHLIEGTNCQRLESALAYVVNEIRGGSHSRRPANARLMEQHRLSSLPRLAPQSREAEYTFSSESSLHATLEAARNVKQPPARRLSDASAALFCAFNRNDKAALKSAYRAVEAVRYSEDVNPYDVHRADLMFHAFFGNRDETLRCADALASEARKISNIEMACKGLRNAAEAVIVYGPTTRAQSLLLESRALAVRLDYHAQVMLADLRLADLCLDAMDLETTQRYLESAAEIAAKHAIRSPLLTGDLLLARCWLAIVSEDMPAASRHSRSVQRTFRGITEGTTLWAKLATRLATQRSRNTKADAADFAILLNSIGSRAHYTSEHLSLTALVLNAKAQGHDTQTRAFARDQLRRIEANGRQPWPFLVHLLA